MVAVLVVPGWHDADMTLTRQEISDRVDGLGWRLVLSALRTTVPTGSLARAVEVAAHLGTVLGPDAQDHLSLDVRSEHLSLTLRTEATYRVSATDLELA